jgi:hypothetical protein
MHFSSSHPKTISAANPPGIFVWLIRIEFPATFDIIDLIILFTAIVHGLRRLFGSAREIWVIKTLVFSPHVITGFVLLHLTTLPIP